MTIAHFDLQSKVVSGFTWCRRNWKLLSWLLVLGGALDRLLPGWVALVVILLAFTVTLVDQLLLLDDDRRRARRSALGLRLGWISADRAELIERRARCWQSRWTGKVARSLRTRVARCLTLPRPRTTRRNFRRRTPRRATATASAGSSDGDGGGDPPAISSHQIVIVPRPLDPGGPGFLLSPSPTSSPSDPQQRSTP